MMPFAPEVSFEACCNVRSRLEYLVVRSHQQLLVIILVFHPWPGMPASHRFGDSPAVSITTRNNGLVKTELQFFPQERGLWLMNEKR